MDSQGIKDRTISGMRNNGLKRTRQRRIISVLLKLVGIKCGRTLDFYASLGLDPDQVEKKTGFRGESVRFDYYGYCRECRENRG